MRRRRFVAAVLAGTVLATRASAHTPYRQWQVYRRKHLLIGCHKDDPAGYVLAKRVVATLDERLPAARARVARGPTAGRIASLMATGQMDVAILGERDALAMADGRDGFEPYGAVPLTLLARLPERVLVARADFPERHAWLVADALAEPADGGTDGDPPLATPDASAGTALDWHPGAERRRRDLPVPHGGPD